MLCNDGSQFDGFGEYRLNFSGDWNYSENFVVSESVKLEREILDTDVSFHKSMIIVGIVCWIVTFIVWVPFPPLNCFNQLSDWIAGENEDYENNCSNKCIKFTGIVFGFLVMKSQIYKNIPRWISMILFFLLFRQFCSNLFIEKWKKLRICLFCWLLFEFICIRLLVSHINFLLYFIRSSSINDNFFRNCLFYSNRKMQLLFLDRY